MPVSRQADYLHLMEKLLLGRAWGTLSEEAEDELLEEMDALWWTLTEEEIEVIKQTHAALKAPEILDLVDVAVTGPAGQIPRKVA